MEKAQKVKKGLVKVLAIVVIAVVLLSVFVVCPIAMISNYEFGPNIYEKKDCPKFGVASIANYRLLVEQRTIGGEYSISSEELELVKKFIAPTLEQDRIKIKDDGKISYKKEVYYNPAILIFEFEQEKYCMEFWYTDEEDKVWRKFCYNGTLYSPGHLHIPAGWDYIAGHLAAQKIDYKDDSRDKFKFAICYYGRVSFINKYWTRYFFHRTVANHTIIELDDGDLYYFDNLTGYCIDIR